MLTGINKKVELTANLAIIIVACLLATVLVKNYLVNKPTAPPNDSQSQPISSPIVSSLDIDWRKSKQTLLLAVSSTCHFCTESASFYKQLAKERGSTRLVAVFPQPITEGRNYLEALGVTVDEIRQAPFNSLNVQATPTLILIDSNGLVIKSWIGKLEEEQQHEVLNKML